MRIDREAVVVAGVGLAQTAGLDSLGVRPVAATLGVTPMALYRHVGDAAALHASVIDRLLDELPSVPSDGRWDARCRRWAISLRECAARTPGMARYLLTRWTRLPRAVVMVDQLGTLLLSSGPAGVDAVAGSNALFTYVLARVQAEEAVALGGRSRDLSGWNELKKAAPFMFKHRAEYEIARSDEHFAYGLDALLSGLAAARRRRSAHT